MKDNQTKKHIITKVSIGINVTTIIVVLVTIFYTGVTRKTFEVGFGSDGFVSRVNSYQQNNTTVISPENSTLKDVGNDNSIKGNSGPVNSNNTTQNGNVYHNNGDGNQNGNNNSSRR